MMQTEVLRRGIMLSRGTLRERRGSEMMQTEVLRRGVMLSRGTLRERRGSEGVCVAVVVVVDGGFLLGFSADFVGEGQIRGICGGPLLQHGRNNVLLCILAPEGLVLLCIRRVPPEGSIRSLRRAAVSNNVVVHGAECGKGRLHPQHAQKEEDRGHEIRSSHGGSVGTAKSRKNCGLDGMNVDADKGKLCATGTDEIIHRLEMFSCPS